MRRLVLQMGVSLDGLVARPGRHGSVGWGLPPENPALKERKLAWLRDTGLHVMGRNTYEEMAEFWPTSDDAYAGPMNDIPKVVFSQTLERAEWADSRIARGDLADEIAELKRESGKDMVAWGGAALAQSPVLYVCASTSSSRSGAVRSLNRGSPSPGATGCSTRRYSSTSPSLVSAALHVYRPAPTAS
jgi:dihydrofolate reductase